MRGQRGLSDRIDRRQRTVTGDGLTVLSEVAECAPLFRPRWVDDQYDQLSALAADLVDRKVDVIAAVGNAARAAKTATEMTSIVFMGVGDPVGEFVSHRVV
jgi:putative ABC transport system substrate-binding protein